MKTILSQVASFLATAYSLAFIVAFVGAGGQVHAQSTYPQPFNLGTYFNSAKFTVSTTGTVPEQFILGWSVGDHPSVSLTNGMEMNSRLGEVSSINYNNLDYRHYLTAPLLSDRDSRAHNYLDTGVRFDQTKAFNPFFGVGIRFDPTSIVRTRVIKGTNESYQETFADTTDPDGGVFGFFTTNGITKSFNASINSYEAILSTTERYPLKDPWPNDEFHYYREGKVNSVRLRNEHFSTTGTIEEVKREQLQNSLRNMQVLRLSVQLRRVAGSNGSAAVPVLHVRVPYSRNNGYGTLDEFTDKKYIRFSKIPDPALPTTNIISAHPPFHRGYQLALKEVPELTTSLTITAGMVQNHQEYVTYTAEFRMLGEGEADDYPPTEGDYPFFTPPYMKNPVLRGNYTLEPDAIKRLGIEVEYNTTSGIQVAIDWIRLATPQGEMLFKGQLDTLLEDFINYTADLYDNAITSGPCTIHRIWLMEEDGPRSYLHHRYINSLIGGIGTTETDISTKPAHRGYLLNSTPQLDGSTSILGLRIFYPDHIRREGRLPDWWIPHTAAFSNTHAVPYAAYAQEDYRTTNGRIYAANTGIQFAALSDHIFNNRSQYELLSRDGFSLTALRNSDSLYNARVENGYAPQTKIEQVMRDYASIPDELFSENRWMLNVWPYSEWDLHDVGPTVGQTRLGLLTGRTSDFFVARTGRRPQTGEEIRQSIWSGLIYGAKGVYYYTSPKTMGTGNGSLDPFENPYQVVEIISPLTEITDKYHLKNAHIGLRSSTQHALRPLSGGTQSTNDLLLSSFGSNKESFVKSPFLGTDFLTFTTDPNYGDDSFLDMLLAPLDEVGAFNGTPADRVYIGRMSARRAVYEENAKLRRKNHELGNTLQRVHLKVAYSHGIRTITTYKDATQYTALASLVKLDSIRTRKIDHGQQEYESKDSSLFDLTLLRDSGEPDVYYIGVLNRRTDPMISINTTDTSVVDGTVYSTSGSWLAATKEIRFLTTSEFLHEVEQGDLDRYAQLGAREFHIPFHTLSNTGTAEFDYWLVEELGTTNRFAVYNGLGTQKLVDKFMPGEGKIYRIQRMSYVADQISGDLEYPNQTKVVSVPELYDTTLHRYYITYQKPIQTGSYHVFYRRSLPVKTTELLSAPLQWEPETRLDSTIHSLAGGSKPYAECRWPSIVVRKDSTVGMPPQLKAYIVYTCNELPHLYSLWSIVETEVIASQLAPPALSGRELYAPAHINSGLCLNGWGAPTINASAFGNYYAWGDSAYGITVGYKPIGTTALIGLNAFSFTAGTQAKHPSLNTYSRYQLGENDCAVVWQELMMHKTRYGWQVPYTRLRYNGVSGLVEPYLYDTGHLVLTGGSTQMPVLDFSGNILLISDEAQQAANYTFPNIYRGVEGKGTLFNGGLPANLINAHWDRIVMNADGAPPFGIPVGPKQLRLKTIAHIGLWADSIQE